MELDLGLESLLPSFWREWYRNCHILFNDECALTTHFSAAGHHHHGDYYVIIIFLLSLFNPSPPTPITSPFKTQTHIVQ